jgi:hypothetical protein
MGAGVLLIAPENVKVFFGSKRMELSGGDGPAAVVTSEYNSRNLSCAARVWCWHRRGQRCSQYKQGQGIGDLLHLDGRGRAGMLGI